MGRFKPFYTAPVAEIAILVGVDRGIGNWSCDDSLAELARLAQTDGAEVVLTMKQRLDAPVPKTFIGKGKVARSSSATSITSTPTSSSSTTSSRRRSNRT